ncbi:uncharacterized protein [Diadema antillarum]|uniref:uncharacterized protein n=1 Tax=Diadema antillarum TaxID=105358 RepID=UPI003A856EDF
MVKFIALCGSLFVLAAVLVIKSTGQDAPAQAVEATSSEDEEVEEEVDFSIPELDPRNPFYTGRPRNVLGTYREPTVHVEEIGRDAEFPSPTEFYERFIRQYRPVVLRGTAKHSPAYQLWTEDYLRQEYGEVTVRLQARSEDSPKIPSGIGGLGRDTLGNYLDRYQTMDGYIVSQLPVAMEKDIAFPPFLTCGSLASAVQEVRLLLSATGGKTLLHHDAYSSVHCVFNGTQQWLVMDPGQEEKLYMSESSHHKFGGYCDVNVDNVDFNQHPLVKELEFAKVILRKGDCIYMPSGYAHQIRMRGYMNSAISIRFSHYLDFDLASCEGSSNLFTPMSQASVIWRYPGHGDIPQGHLDVHILRAVMKTTADEAGEISLHEFTENLIQGEVTDEDVLINQRLQFMELLVPYVSRPGVITVEELDGLSIDTLKKLIELLDPVDASNTADFEYSHIQPDGIWSAISMLRGANPTQFFSRRDFIKIYTIYLGGTETVASEILSVLDPDGTDQITGRMVMTNGDRAFAKFGQRAPCDSTIERLWYKQFASNDLFRKYSVPHSVEEAIEEPSFTEENTSFEDRHDEL